MKKMWKRMVSVCVIVMLAVIFLSVSGRKRFHGMKIAEMDSDIILAGDKFICNGYVFERSSDKMEESKELVKENEKNMEETVFVGDQVEVYKVKSLDEPQYVCSEWNDMDAKDAIVQNDVIFEGSILSCSEIEINTEWLDTKSTIYKTLLDVRVNSVIHEKQKGLEENEKIRIAVSISSRQYDSYAASLVEGNEYLFVASDVSSLENDTLQLKEYCDYYISAPVEYVMPCIENQYYEIRGKMNELVKEDSNPMLENLDGANHLEMLYDDSSTLYVVSKEKMVEEILNCLNENNGFSESCVNR